MFRRCAQHMGLRNAAYIVFGLGVLLLCNGMVTLWQIRTPLQPSHRTALSVPESRRSHPIHILIAEAERSFGELISGHTHDLVSATNAYRQKRGRHPPPGFDLWFQYAQKNGALVIEELFDQMHSDLAPFWGVSASSMRDFARHFEHRISVRNRSVSMTRNHGQGTATGRMEAWLEMIESIEHLLPDLDMAMNVMDESRVVVPWEDSSKYLQSERQKKKLLAYDDVSSQYSSLNASNEVSRPPHVKWLGPGGEPYWDMARVACAPDSPARYQVASTNFTGPPPIHSAYPAHSYRGYVQNWAHARDPCQQRYLQESHGTFIEPISISTTRALVPIFGETKLQLNSDILIPAAAYLSENFSGGDYSDSRMHGGEWSAKVTGAVWRGVASGGRNKEENWTRFHRHRFITMLNGTYVEKVETDSDAVAKGRTFNLQSYATYQLSATKHMNLGRWLNQITNAGFTEMLCWPHTDKPNCNYTNPYFKIVDKVPMSEQYKYKLLPDIDGNSFSGRYLAYLRSTSVPIKATIYSEWHDDRIIPWLHFVPMDNSYVDVYGILDYFLGTGDSHMVVSNGAHDEAAKKIALRGQEWADKVLRKEDMHVYTFRLLLEYARLCDDNRERLGFVEDLRA
ncbi:CAP10 domain containing protein [Pyrenophora teres f. maculata]|nr:CAP10 domain containing protein [Pyrenophora teres f. maculata]